MHGNCVHADADSNWRSWLTVKIVTQRGVLNFFHQPCWINALTLFLCVHKSKCNSKRPFCAEVLMHKEQVASLHSTAYAFCVHPFVPLSFTKLLLHPTSSWTPLWLHFQGQTPSFWGWVGPYCLLTCSRSILYQSSLSIPETGIPSCLRLRPSLTGLIQPHILPIKKSPFYWEVQQFWHPAEHLRDLGLVPC